MQLIKFETKDLLTFDEIEQLIISVRPNQKALIVSSKLINYLLINNDDFYRFDVEKVLYIKENNDDNYLITLITLFIEESYNNLSSKDQEILQLKYKKSYDNIFRNIDVHKYLPQLLTYLTNNKINFSNAHLYEIHFQNGYFDFNTGTFKKRIQGKHFLNVYIKRDFNVPSKEDLDRVFSDIDKIYPNKADRDYLLMTLGLSLTGVSCADQTMLFLVGLGSTGKSTILELCKLSLEDYVFTLPKQTFSKGYSKIDKVMNSYLEKQHIRISHINEPEDTKIDDSLFKDFTDGKIQSTSLYKDGSNDFTHNSKLCSTSNTFPNIKIDTGTVRRINSYTHTSNFVKDRSDVDEKKHHYYADLNFLKDLETDEKYLNAFFNILSSYGYDWLTKKTIYAETENFKSTKNSIVSCNDIMQDFIDQHLIITRKDKDRISRVEMYDFFKSVNPKSFITPQQLFNQLKQKEIMFHDDYRHNKLKGCYTEIRFRNSSDPDIVEVDEAKVETEENNIDLKLKALEEENKALKEQLSKYKALCGEPIIDIVIEPIIDIDDDISVLTECTTQSKEKKIIKVLKFKPEALEGLSDKEVIEFLSVEKVSRFSKDNQQKAGDILKQSQLRLTQQQIKRTYNWKDIEDCVTNQEKLDYFEKTYNEYSEESKVKINDAIKELKIKINKTKAHERGEAIEEDIIYDNISCSDVSVQSSLVSITSVEKKPAHKNKVQKKYKSRVNNSDQEIDLENFEL